MGKDLKGRELGKRLSQRKDGRYQARFTNRYGQRIGCIDKNLNIVKEWLKRERAKNDLRINAKQCSDILNIWYERWKDMAFVDLAIGTQRIYSNAYRLMIEPELKNVKISDITEFRLKQFFQNLKKEYEDSSICIAKNVLTQIMQCCKDADCITYNPVKEVKLKRQKGQSHKLDVKALKLSDQQELFAYLKGHYYYNMLVFIVNTGLRYGECAGLTVDDIDLKNRIVKIRRSIKYEKVDHHYEFFFGETKTPSSVRDVPLNDYAVQAIKRQFILKKRVEKSKLADKSVPPNMRNLLFVTPFNTPVANGYLNGVLRRACQQINYQREECDYIKQVSVHKLRHTFATRCFEADIPMKIISKYLGHRDVTITEQIYVHLLLDYVNLQSDKLNEIFSESNFEEESSEPLLYSIQKEINANGVKMESA